MGYNIVLISGYASSSITLAGRIDVVQMLFEIHTASTLPSHTLLQQPRSNKIKANMLEKQMRRGADSVTFDLSQHISAQPHLMLLEMFAFWIVFQIINEIL